MPPVLVHEWLTNVAGSEKVVARLRRLFPDAPVCTTMRWRGAFPDWDPVRTTALQALATGPSSHVRALPLMPVAWRATRLPSADLYISSFHTFALYARVPRDAPHVVYCHTPPRFLWRRDQFSRGGALGAAMAASCAVLRPIDRRRARHPSLFVANSKAVAERILHAYGREARVVHPPVDLARFTACAGAPRDDYFLFFSRLVPYKRPELVLAAFAELGWPLVVAGDGRSRAALERSAPPNVRFVGRVPDDDLPGLLARARALIFPAEEDFGIVPVEAMAAGTPVVAFGVGGALDYVVEGVNGVLFAGQTPAGLIRAVREAAAQDWDATAVSASVASFGPDRFDREMRDVVASALSR